ncbi:pyridine nucleotide-disulfide oxidoreductase [Plantibacter sp. Leaf171]|uniref:FAD/NAD(P)-dependent oxidoreductase n=1 Tax=unclassified Plantibacter TaxID=2624265 RepID=UPI0006F60189|nr:MULTISPECIES: NAD(P)/FAD-dependent oxidoreductase [unclassified Plantibacter]KQM15912.1 pyridine nucleotide-disulfide oxidoreductase [Plantibacter sp. Leaf1]KQR59055.1 pyridine nucleotide-disulfide oxidoreductase [Plantibacter sp. Leaf171]
MSARQRDVVVVGAGPAGLQAALAARALGASVTLLDASDELGGQYWRHLPASRPSAAEASLHHGFERFLAMRAALDADAGCTVVTEAQVWAIDVDRDAPADDATMTGLRLHVLVGPPDGADRTPLTIRPDALVLATGAHDRTLPFPGWDLPGVFSAGAAQALAKGERVAVGQRVVVAGAGPFLLPVAASLTATGSRVLGVYEATTVGGLAAGWLPKPWQLLGVTGKVGELIGYVSGHLRHRIPYRVGHAVVAAHGTERVERVTIAAVDADWSPIPGTDRTVEADAVCVSHGFTPRLELAIAAGCALTPTRFVEVDAEQRTSVPTVFAAGEITGIGGVDAALAEGAIAGHAAAGGLPGASGIRSAVGRRDTFLAFTERLERAHGIREGWSDWLEDDTTICRCEEVDHGALRGTATATCATGLRSLKLSTRAGLGICQGRMCGRTVEELLHRVARESGGDGLIDGVSSDRRPIASPIRIGELAAQGPEPTSHEPTSTPSTERLG